MRTALVSLIAFVGLAGAAAAQPAEAPPVEAPVAPAAEAQAAVDPATQPQRPAAGDGAQLLDMIERVCVPLVRGGNVDQLARAYGMRKQRQRYVTQLGQKPYQVFLEPQGSNREVCELTVEYAQGQERPIIQALNVWAFLHEPELKLQRSDIITTDLKRITTSWEHYTSTDSIGLVFVQERQPNDQSMGRNFDRAKLLYSERKIDTTT